MGFRELARWRIFSESLVDGLWQTDTLANPWPIFDECLANGIWGTETLTNLWPQYGESLANGFWGTDTLANLWRIVFSELTRWRIFCEWLLGK